MIRRLVGALTALAMTTTFASPSQAQDRPTLAATPAIASPLDMTVQPAIVGPTARPMSEASLTPHQDAMRQALANSPEGTTDEERNERAALLAFYEARSFEPIWVAKTELTGGGSAVVTEIKHANEWGLDLRDFALPPDGEMINPTPVTLAQVETTLSLAVLKYARYARGGRIINPSEQLSTYLDRRPQLADPKVVITTIATATEPGTFLRMMHPQHPQFEKLRQKYLAVVNKKELNAKSESSDAKRLLANMEEWRWMPIDMGDFYVWNNIPEFTQRVVKAGEVINTERIVAGELSKQTPIFSRPMRKVTFKPTWKVPESIKVRELWPSLLRGGGLMTQWALEVQTKEGQPVNWRTMNWAKTDIREYDVIQPNGPKSVMGKVKFSFPNPHTVFMHDTLERDKYMFNIGQRTFSHGCMRVRNPMKLAELLMQQDKGWDTAKVTEVFKTGPLNNEIPLDRWVPVHITYFTAWVSDDGKLHTFRDMYGHERRITQALEGKWTQIAKGRDHLAPVELNLASAKEPRSTDDGAPHTRMSAVGPRPPRKQLKPAASGGDFLSSLFGGF
jgi:L,D-transpeptidase YcbB